jgi:hypothetical protein
MGCGLKTALLLDQIYRESIVSVLVSALGSRWPANALTKTDTLN